MRPDNSTEWYHVILTSKESRRLEEGPEYDSDFSFEELERRFLTPYRKGKSLVINGKTITTDDLDRIRIFKTEQKIENSLKRISWYTLPEVTKKLITAPPPAANQKLLLILPRNLDLHQPLRRFSSFMGETEKHGKHFFLSYGRSVSAPWNGQRLSSLRENRCLISEKSWMLPFRGHMLLLFF